MRHYGFLFRLLPYEREAESCLIIDNERKEIYLSSPSKFGKRSKVCTSSI